jgi:hypothetical protein
MEGFRRDIDLALGYWKEILRQCQVEYAYAKGSATKSWDSKIDYVPIVSDLDIHYRSSKDLGFDLQRSIAIMNEYEEYMHQNHCSHVPRLQLMSIHEFGDDFVPPLPEQIKPIIGQPRFHTIPEDSRFREIDRLHLLDEQDYLDRMHERALECTGVEVWRRVREITWRVSPAPVRLLSQIEEPSEVWIWNRTEICNKLKRHGFEELEKVYREFYMLGWDYFQAGLVDTKIGLEMYRLAFEVIKLSIEEIQQLD